MTDTPQVSEIASTFLSFASFPPSQREGKPCKERGQEIRVIIFIMMASKYLHLLLLLVHDTGGDVHSYSLTQQM